MKFRYRFPRPPKLPQKGEIMLLQTRHAFSVERGLGKISIAAKAFFHWAARIVAKSALRLESRALPLNGPWGYRLPRSISDDRCHDRDPNCVQSPIDVLSRSTTDDADSNNAPVRHSSPVAFPRLRGCARPCHGSLCPILLPPFRLHAGTSLCHRHAPVVLLQTTKAPQPLPQPLLFFQIVDSRLSPLC